MACDNASLSFGRSASWISRQMLRTDRIALPDEIDDARRAGTLLFGRAVEFDCALIVELAREFAAGFASAFTDGFVSSLVSGLASGFDFGAACKSDCGFDSETVCAFAPGFDGWFGC